MVGCGLGHRIEAQLVALASGCAFVVVESEECPEVVLESFHGRKLLKAPADHKDLPRAYYTANIGPGLHRLLPHNLRRCRCVLRMVLGILKAVSPESIVFKSYGLATYWSRWLFIFIMFMSHSGVRHFQIASAQNRNKMPGKSPKEVDVKSRTRIKRAR